MAARNLVKPAVVPEESERWTTAMLVLGRLMPELSALIAGSFQVLIWPRKIFEIVGPSSLMPLLTPDRL